MKTFFIFILIIIIGAMGLSSLFSFDGNSCGAVTGCGFLAHICILLFLTTVYSYFSPYSVVQPEVVKIIKTAGVSLCVGFFVALLTWPVTYYEYSTPCHDYKIENCYLNDKVVGYISFSRSEAVEKLSKYKVKPLYSIEKGTIWPGFSAYYSFSPYDSQMKGEFNGEVYVEAMFLYSYFVVIFTILLNILRFAYYKYIKKSM